MLGEYATIGNMMSKPYWRRSCGSIGVDELVAKGAVRKNSLIKVLGDGKLTVKVEVSAHKFSGSAREKITAAGGSATEL